MMRMVDMNRTNKWLNLKLTAHMEGFIAAVQEQELSTEETQKRREKALGKKKTMDTGCRICNQQPELVYHVTCSCPVLPPTLYLDVQHNQVAKTFTRKLSKMTT